MDTPTITLFYAGILAVLWLLLTLNVTRFRVKHQVAFGDGGIEDIARAQRMQGNFVETVPIALILLLGLEMAGMADWAMHLAGGLLVIARIAHAYGLSGTSGQSPGRMVGTLLSWAIMLFVAVAAVYLGAYNQFWFLAAG